MKQLIINNFVYGSVKIPYILYIQSNDETIKNFILPSNPFKNCTYNEYLKKLTYKKLYDKVREIEEHDIKYKFIIICEYLKDKFFCGCAVHKLC
jgi:hypothetical protein